MPRVSDLRQYLAKNVYTSIYYDKESVSLRKTKQYFVISPGVLIATKSKF